jgi:hypothetical protein
VPQNLQELRRPIALLDPGGGNDQGEDQPEGVNQEVTLTPLDLLARVIAPEPPFAVVFTDGLALRPALGWRRLPAATRTSPRSKSCMSGQVPSRRHGQKS